MSVNLLTLEQQRVAIEILKTLSQDGDTILKDLQGDHCGCNGGKSKMVYRSPSAYKVGKILEAALPWIELL